MISINTDVNYLNDKLKNNLKKTEKIVEIYQKQFLYSVIVQEYKKQYIKNQRRIYVVKSPILTVKNILQNILGENIENLDFIESLDFSVLDEENSRTKNIIDKLNYNSYIKYYDEINKYGLKKTNKKWINLVN